MSWKLDITKIRCVFFFSLSVVFPQKHYIRHVRSFSPEKLYTACQYFFSRQNYIRYVSSFFPQKNYIRHVRSVSPEKLYMACQSWDFPQKNYIWHVSHEIFPRKIIYGMSVMRFSPEKLYTACQYSFPPRTMAMISTLFTPPPRPREIMAMLYVDSPTMNWP